MHRQHKGIRGMAPLEQGSRDHGCSDGGGDLHLGSCMKYSSNEDDTNILSAIILLRQKLSEQLS